MGYRLLIKYREMYIPMHTVYVITICRNAESIIEDTIKSVLSQTYINIKYLIIDGASTDGTVGIIKKYQDKLVYWMSEPDKGIYDAMNKGLVIARRLSGNEEYCWVNFMNAGDTFADNNVLSDIFSRKHYDGHVIGGHANLVYFNHTEVLYAQNPETTCHQLPYCHQSSFVRLTIENSQWLFDTKYKIAADYKVFYDVFDRYGSMAFHNVDRVVANYKMDGSMTFNNLRKAKKEYLSIQSVHKNFTWWKNYIKWLCHR